MTATRVVIFGSRNAFPTDENIVTGLGLLDLEHWRTVEVVCGMAGGADRSGYEWAKRNDLAVHEFPADWNKYGKRAGFIRNRQMAEFAHCGLGFWRGESNGTANMATWLAVEGKDCKVVLL